VNQRWLGGTLTNWKTIKSRIDQLKRFESERESGATNAMFTKKERLTRDRMIEKLQIRLGGLRHMSRLPAMVFVVDVRREYNAVKEANALKIPVVALVDTNCNPDMIDFVIPANDDAIRAIKLLTGKIADAALEGIAMRKGSGDVEIEEHESMNADAETMTSYKYEGDDEFSEDEDEAFLGESTLAKLRSGAYDEDEGGKS